jgi:outer membrane protein assembly factor BamB
MPPTGHTKGRGLPRSLRLARTITAAAVIVGAILFLTMRSAGHDPPARSATGGTRGARAATGGAPRSAVTAAQSHCPCPNLVPGSNPAALPGQVLVADHRNNRLLIIAPNGTVTWEFPRPGDLSAGQTFLVPDDAFVTPDGRYIVVTEEDDYVISMVSIAAHRIVWRYGTPGVPGSGPNQLWNPDDAMMMPDGNIVAADIKNCRILVLRPGFNQPVHIFGITTQGCWHNPPTNWGSPNGAFPMRNGDYLVTEINGDWVDELTLSGAVRFSTNPPGIAYPSDTNEVRPGVYLTSDYSYPGQVEEFNGAGQLLWRFAPPGAAALDHPSLALPMPNGDILCNDDFNHRVIVIDPAANRIVWQYGHTGVAGSTPGYLNDPDGVDLMPPLSLTIASAASMGEYPVPPGAGPVPGTAGH